MSTTDVTNREIRLVGAMGGVCLALLKLTEDKFFVSDPLGITAIAAYLTYLTNIFLGIVVANFFVEKELPPEKLRKNALILGLLAPSLLLALSNQPTRGEQDQTRSQTKDIPDITEVLTSNAWAAPTCPSGQILVESQEVRTCSKAKLITKQEFEPTFYEAVKKALGRGTISKKYSFVIGKTSDAIKAEKFAARVNDTVLVGHGFGAQVIKPEGKNMFYVTVGDPANQHDTVDITKAIQKKAIDELKSSSSPNSKVFAERLLKGQIVKTRSLF